MIRKAVQSDIDSIEKSYQMHFNHEKEHGAYTLFQEGVYPTRKVAEAAINDGSLYVYDEKGEVLGSIIFDGKQPEEYEKIDWPSKMSNECAGVIHLLMVRPDAAGRGVGSALVAYVTDMAKRQNRAAVRLDTGAQNTPASSLYKKLGFQLASISPMKVGGIIPHNEHLFFEKMI